MIGLFAVRGRSMAPTLIEGDLVVTASLRLRRPAVGDVVVARTPFGSVIHRVVDRDLGDDGSPIYALRGDANRRVDPFAVSMGELLGVAALRLRGWGRPRLWLAGRVRWRRPDQLLSRLIRSSDSICRFDHSTERGN